MFCFRIAALAVLLMSALAIQHGVAQTSENLPTLPGAQKMSENPTGKGTHYYYQTSNSPASIVDGYKEPLRSTGWKIERSGSGGGEWGGTASLTATKGQSYLVLQAGGPRGKTFVNLCVWPSLPDNDYC
jgi:hypothetical protein